MWNVAHKMCVRPLPFYFPWQAGHGQTSCRHYITPLSSCASLPPHMLTIMALSIPHFLAQWCNSSELTSILHWSFYVSPQEGLKAFASKQEVFCERG